MTDKIDVSGLFGKNKTADEKIQTVGVMVEALHSKMDTVIEGVDGLNAKIDRKTEELKEELKVEIQWDICSDYKWLD